MNHQEQANVLFEQANEHGAAVVIAATFHLPIRTRLGFSSKACALPIEEMELSVRAYNCLKRSNVHTVGELIDIVNSDGLLKIRNLGKKSLIEIKTALLAIGYEFLSERGRRSFWNEMLELNADKKK